MKMMRNLMSAALAAMALFTLTARAEPDELLLRYLPEPGEEYLVTDQNILAGLTTGALAVEITKGKYLPVPIPAGLKDASGHCYTIAMKIKVKPGNGKVCLFSLPPKNNPSDTDAMIYLDSGERKIHVKQFRSDRDSAVSDRGVEPNVWTTVAVAFMEDWIEIYIDGDPVYSESAQIAGSRADCYKAGDYMDLGRDNDGEDNAFYLADFRIYDGARPAGDELWGYGAKDSPFLINSAADWALFADNICRGMTSGLATPYYRLTTNIGSAAVPITQAVGELYYPFSGFFDGGSNTIHFAISGDAAGTAPFGRTDNAEILNLKVTGSVSSTADHAAGLVGICDGLTIVENCTVSTSVSVSGAGHAGGVIGHGGNDTQVMIKDTVFSGTISGFSAHAGGLLGWCDTMDTLSLINCLFKGSFSGSGKYHPICCKSDSGAIPSRLGSSGVYYLNTVTPTEDAANIIPKAEGRPVSATRISGSFEQRVTAADGNVYYQYSLVTLTPATGDLLLRDGDILTGTGGPDTHVFIDDGATVTLRDVNISAIPNDGDHMWPGITCQGDVTITLDGANVVKGGYEYFPGIFVIPNHTLIIQGDGTLDVSSNGFGAGIGAGRTSGLSCGNIVIESGTITATGGAQSAGIGGGTNSECGTITITGGTVTATGGRLAAGIGGGALGTCGTITLSGGTITATGGEGGPGIGGGGQAASPDIVITEGVTSVTADSGASSPHSVGAGYNGTSGTLTVDGTVMDEITASHFVYSPGIITIATTADWEAFASRVNRGVDLYRGTTVTLTADVAISTIVGMNGNPFCGIFDGGGHTLTVNISSAEQCAAPFRQINGATIHDLTVVGTVTGGGYHAAGLVGGCGNDRPNTIRNCTVAAAVNGTGYAGGIVGHGGQGTLTLEGCVFSGTVSGFANFAGGILGWCDALTLQMDNCLTTGTFIPTGNGKFHPVACRFANRTVTATVTGAYYLNTIVPTVLGTNPTVATSNLIPGAEGIPVSATLVQGEWSQPVTAADGLTYYSWTSAPAGRLLAHLSFDDYGNGGLNLLNADVGLDAIVRATPATSVAGIGEMVAVSEADILSGLPAGDGAIAIPNGQYFAVPIPAALLSDHGRPYTIVMKIRVPNTVGWRSLLNMPASNDTDAMVYLQRTTRNVYLKQFSKVSGEGIAAANGFVPADQWTTLTFAFGENATDVYLDGTPILHTDGALAGSYADCAAAGGYILVGADDSGDDDLFYLSDFRIYEGAIAVAGILPGSGTPADPYLISSTADWDIFAANVNAGINSDACYCLAADIAITTTVGTSDHPFGGIFDGAGHTLNAAITGDSQGCAPFRYVTGATIRRLNTTGTVTLTTSGDGCYHASGLVGFANGVTIERCRVSVAITFPSNAGKVYCGGFIGHALSAPFTMTDCAFDGVIGGSSALANVGGLVGWNDNSTPNITNCLNAGTFSNPGPIAKIARVGGRGSIVNCYSTVNATSVGDNNDNRGTYTTATGTALRDLFGPNWMVTDVAAAPVYVTPPHDGSNYVIGSTPDWCAFAASVAAGKRYLGQTVKMTADIDSVSMSAGTGDHPFCGAFDGGGHTLTANLSGTDSYVAPFFAIGGATIRDLAVAGTVSGNMHCSGLVGCIVNGTSVIENCEVAAAISSSGSHFGGFIGHGLTSAVTLRGCVFSGSLSGGTYVATFNGWSDGGAATTLIDCLDASDSTHPIGRGHDAVCVSNTYYLVSKDFSYGQRLWSEGKRGKWAYAVTAGEGVTIDFGASASYGTSGVTAYATGLAFGGNFYASSGETISLGLAYTGVPSSGTVLDGFAASAGDLVRDGDGWRLAMPDAGVTVSAVFRSATGYAAWATENGITGAWDAKDALGIPNVFRYAFGKPTGSFANPPLISITIDADGNAVIQTPKVVNGAGFELTIRAFDDLDGTGATDYPIDPAGETVIPTNGKKARFFRLKATEK